MWRKTKHTMIYKISVGTKMSAWQRVQLGKHGARFLPLNVPLKGNLAWNPWHVWWNSAAPCVQWKSPRALDCTCARVDVCMCACSCRPASVVFHWGKSTLSISCHVWLPSVGTDNTASSATANWPINKHSANRKTVTRHATSTLANEKHFRGKNPAKEWRMCRDTAFCTEPFPSYGLEVGHFYLNQGKRLWNVYAGRFMRELLPGKTLFLYKNLNKNICKSRTCPLLKCLKCGAAGGYKKRKPAGNDTSWTNFSLRL